LYPSLASWLQPAVYLLALLVLSAVFVLVRPLLKRDKLIAFWALGSLLAALPACSTFPEDRLLCATSVGASALLAIFFMSVWDASYPNATRWVRVACGALAVLHLAIAPVMFVVRTLSIDTLNTLLERADSSVVSGTQAADKTVIFVNPPVALLAVYFPWFRGARGEALPKHLRWLATGESAVHIERVDDNTLRVAPEAGFLGDTTQQMFRRADRSPKVGSVIRFEGVSFEVSAATPNGRPTEVLVRFDERLESDQFQWLKWGEHAYVPFELPAVGQQVTLPAIDLFSVF
jgi:hypothetical protein